MISLISMVLLITVCYIMQLTDIDLHYSLFRISCRIFMNALLYHLDLQNSEIFFTEERDN